jgi:hypothetical protein
MTDEERIAARLDALKDPHFSGEDLVRLIRRELARTSGRSAVETARLL